MFDESFYQHLCLTSQMAFRLCLFYTCFCVCGATHATRCLVTNQTVFYTAGPTKKLSLKHSFCEAVFTCFFNWVSNPCLFLLFKSGFENIWDFFYFFLCFKLIFFFMFSDYFDALISKIIFFKIKKYYFDAFQSKKHFEKQPQPHFHQTF